MSSQFPYEDWLEAIERGGVNLTIREEEFIESIREQVDRGRVLSDKQIQWIEDIYTNRVP